MYLIPIYCMCMEATSQLKVLLPESTKSDSVSLFFFVKTGIAPWPLY